MLIECQAKERDRGREPKAESRKPKKKRRRAPGEPRRLTPDEEPCDTHVLRHPVRCVRSVPGSGKGEPGEMAANALEVRIVLARTNPFI